MIALMLAGITMSPEPSIDIKDPLYMTYQHHIFQSIGYEEGYDGTGVTMGLVDSGINTAHEDLQEAHIPYAMNFAGEASEDTGDKTGHGTFIAGLIGAKKNNDLGIAGLTPEVTMVSLKCFDDHLTTDIETVIQCIDEAIALEVDVLNLSLTTPTYSEALKDAVDRALERQIIVIAPSGNDLSGKSYYPASFEGVIAVNAIRIEPVGLKVTTAQTSNPNNEVTIAAPGDDLLSIGHKAPDDYKQRSGSSYAAAYVSAAAIMAKQHTPTIDPKAFEALITTTSRDEGEAGYDPVYGHGILNIAAMLEALDAQAKGSLEE